MPRGGFGPRIAKRGRRSDPRPAPRGAAAVIADHREPAADFDGCSDPCRAAAGAEVVLDGRQLVASRAFDRLIVRRPACWARIRATRLDRLQEKIEGLCEPLLALNLQLPSDVFQVDSQPG